MKTAVLILCFFCTTLAFGQVAGLGASVTNAEPQPLQFYTHAAHATHRAMATEESLLQPSAYLSARGERPLWEVAKLPEAVPLGDIARALREEHEVVKKSEVVWVNQ
jgi:hypothetical protein